MKNKVLFIGDLRDAGNYGAIATSEALIELINKSRTLHLNDIITYKSLYSPTPLNGQRKEKILVKFFRQKIKSIVSKVSPTFVKDFLKLVFKQKPPVGKDFIPYKFSQYDEYAKKAINGEILQYEVELIKRNEIIIINGEGNIVNGTDEFGMYRCGARYILFIAYLSKVYLKKNTCIINHTVDPQNNDAIEMIKNTYPLLDWISVRETLSKNYLIDLKIKCNLHFHADALFSYQIKNELENRDIENLIDFSKPYICIGDSSAIRGQMSKVKWNVNITFENLIKEIKQLCHQIVFIDGYSGKHKEINKVLKQTKSIQLNLQNCSYHDLAIVLGKSQLFISGRWHASILACLSSTPFILWGADSLKTKALNKLYDDFSAFFDIPTLPIHITEIAAESRRIIKDNVKIKQLMDEKLKQLINSSNSMISDFENNFNNYKS